MTKPNSIKTKIWFFLFKILKFQNPNLNDYQGQVQIQVKIEVFKIYSDYLPKQPVPKLIETVNKYIESCKGYKTKDEIEKLEKAGLDFIKNEGKYLQRKIEAKALVENNYHSDHWSRFNYLKVLILSRTIVYICIKFRGSLLMSNMAGADSITPPTSNLASRAAALVSNYLDFFNLIKTKKLKPPLLQGKPLMGHKN